jgi:hypothetical protein
VPEVLDMPQIADRGFLKHYDDVPGVGRDIDVVTTGVKLDGAAVSVDDPPPELGQDNAAIWGALGSRPRRDRAAQEGGRDMSGGASDVSDWWRDRDHRHGAGPDPPARPPDRGADRRLTFPQMIWLMTRGEMPSRRRRGFWNRARRGGGSRAASALHRRGAHGGDLRARPQRRDGRAAVNMLDDVHGGAGEQAVELMGWIDAAARGGRGPRPPP